MKALIIGYGEIGKAVFEVFKDFHTLCVHDPFHKKKYTVNRFTGDILIIAIPYNDKFVDTVKEYQKKFDTKATLIFSTTAIGTCKELNAVHSPIEGKHPELAFSLRKGKRWVGGADAHVLNFFFQADFKLKDLEILPEPEWTEFLKLRSTSLYGVNIEFARYSKEVADKLNMPFEYIMNFDKNYNELYKKLKMPQFSRYILTPPKGEIGGHCVVPNAKILNKQFPNAMLGEIFKKK